MFISSIGIESLLGGSAGLVLVLGNAGPVLGEASGVTGPISEENLASSLQPVGYYVTNIKKIIFLVIKYLNHWFKSLYIGAYPIDSPQNISYYWT